MGELCVSTCMASASIFCFIAARFLEFETSAPISVSTPVTNDAMSGSTARRLSGRLPPPNRSLRRGHKVSAKWRRRENGDLPSLYKVIHEGGDPLSIHR